MSYRYYVNKRSPLSAWILDDTVPFQENTGSNATGNKKTGTSDPTTASALVSGAAFASVFSSSSVGQFQCPVFMQGYEQDSFALEAWLYPIQKSSGLVARAIRTNYALNPSAEASTTDFTVWPGTGGSATLSRQTSGGQASTSYVRATWTVASTTNGDISYQIQNGVFSPGDPVSFSVVLRANTARAFQPSIQWQDSSGTPVATSVGTATGTISANIWNVISMTNIVMPAGASKFKVMARTVTAMSATDTLDVDAFMVEKTTSAPKYFDGTFPGYEWSGTANASTSRTKANISRVNYVANPSCEGTTGWLNGGANGTTTSVATGSAYTGSSVLQVTRTNTTAGNCYARTLFATPPGIYTASVYLRSVGGTPGVKVYAGRGDFALTYATTTNVALTSNWQRYTLTFTVPDGSYISQLVIADDGQASNDVGDSWQIDAVLVEEGSSVGSYFDGNSEGAAWSGTSGNSWSYLKTSNSQQQILSHNGIYDGLTINGNVLKFSTQYSTTGEAACTYDLLQPRAAHVVAVHSPGKNELYVDGELVSSVDVSDAQMLDSYVSTDGYLYSGLTTSSQEIAMNGIAFYTSISSQDILANYSAGINVISQDSINTQFSGVGFPMNSASGNIGFSKTWATRDDFDGGYNQNVAYSDTQIVPKDVNGTSEAGSWTAPVALDQGDLTALYGVYASWSASGVTVDASVDGTTWTTIVNGELISIIPNGFNPTGVDLQIRFTFAGGVVSDPSFIDSLTVIGFTGNVVENSEERVISVTYPAVLRDNYEPIFYREDNGIYLDGATLTIGTENSTDPLIPRTLELWIKVVSGSPTISVSGTTYVNGAADSSLPLGQWRLMHIVSATDITSSITISGDVIIGQVALYKTPLAAADVDTIYRSYTGAPAIVFNDTSSIAISEPSTPYSLYTMDWSIDSAGG